MADFVLEFATATVRTAPDEAVKENIRIERRHMEEENRPCSKYYNESMYYTNLYILLVIF